MILVDTSVWVDYLRGGRGQLKNLLEDNQVLVHPSVIGELASARLSHDAQLWKHDKRLAAVAGDLSVAH